MKIGNEIVAVFGGTFDPPHNGHAQIAGKILESGKADKVIFVPAFHPPHKPGFPITNFTHRLNMLELATSGDERFEVSDIESRRKGPSFTFDTMAEFEKLFPGTEIRLLMGSDSLCQFHTWYKAKEMLDRWRLIVYPRNGHMPSVDDLKANWGMEVAERLRGYILPVTYFDLSSTEIRRKILDAEDVACLVDKKVGKYIIENGIYK
ncbi:MAG: nicotinate (nicotinamide) nucleotide adenylyltransferase [Lentisphaerae bacterium GWF2_50_93]|nr:MAG: nicotinate (nicotinamide) nucleotide adenylyltransferase [Lentisphaerae bacterium GWF2_50_93]